MCSIVPNSWRHICDFATTYVLAGIEPNITLFLYYYTLKRHPKSRGWWYVTSRGKKNILPLIRGASSAVNGWKWCFLFISCTSSKHWDFLDWGEPQMTMLRDPSLDQHLKEDLETLHGFKSLKLKELLYCQKNIWIQLLREVECDI